MLRVPRGGFPHEARGYELAVIETGATPSICSIGSRVFRYASSSGTSWTVSARNVMAMCDTYVRIPMLGLKHSLNVATAGGIVMYELLRKYRAAHTSRTHRKLIFVVALSGVFEVLAATR